MDDRRARPVRLIRRAATLAMLGLALTLAAGATAQPRPPRPAPDGALPDNAPRFVEWLPPDLDSRPAGSTRLIVTLHGSGGRAQREVDLWQPYARARGAGILAVQWWLGGDRYLPPQEIYRLLEERLADLRRAHPAIAERGHLLHGFSRGSAVLPGLARIDARTGRRLYGLFVCNSGAWPPENPPPYVREVLAAGDRTAFAGQRFVAYFGGRDEDRGPGAAGEGRALRRFIEEHGGTFVHFFEPADGRHGTFHHDAAMLNATLDAWRE